MDKYFPWLVSRKRVIGLSILDAIAFSGVAFASYSKNYHEINNIYLSLLYFNLYLLIWICLSYVAGRYIPIVSLKTKNIFNTFIVIILTAIVFTFILDPLVCSLFLYKSPVYISNNRLEYMFSLSIASYALQLGCGFFWFSRIRVAKKWLVLSSKSFMNLLVKWSQYRRVDCELESIDYEDLYNLKDGHIAGVVIERFSLIDDKYISKLIDLELSGMVILDSISWCERILQRFPPSLLTPFELLGGKFVVASNRVELRMKRLGDFTLALILLIVSSPVICLSALLIKLEDNGPAFYSQRRVGFKGKIFRLRKLRTMSVDAEVKGVSWSKTGDPRITKVGSFLRRSRIDELPQLISVLSGDMSLIGPRPERPEFESALKTDIVYYSMRHLIRPGLSGWAQVNYPYGASKTDSENKLSYDLYYLRNYSIWMDFLILFKTIKLVMHLQGSTPMDANAQNN